MRPRVCLVCSSEQLLLHKNIAYCSRETNILVAKYPSTRSSSHVTREFVRVAPRSSWLHGLHKSRQDSVQWRLGRSRRTLYGCSLPGYRRARRKEIQVRWACSSSSSARRSGVHPTATTARVSVPANKTIYR